MTPKGAAQFTPSQVLDAGRRAEAEGRLEYAVQFYRHLTDYYPQAPEAAQAQEALARLQIKPGQGDGAYVNGSHNGSRQGHMNGHAAHQPVHLAASHGGAPAAAPTAYHLDHVPRTGSPQRRPAGSAQPADPRQRHRATLPAPASGYRIGRLLARVTTAVGLLAVVAGIAAIPIAILSPRLFATVPDAGPLLGTFAFGVTTLVGGLVLAVLGQVARALLEQANATKDLVAIARAKADHDAHHERHQAR